MVRALGAHGQSRRFGAVSVMFGLPLIADLYGWADFVAKGHAEVAANNDAFSPAWTDDLIEVKHCLPKRPFSAMSLKRDDAQSEIASRFSVTAVTSPANDP